MSINTGAISPGTTVNDTSVGGTNAWVNPNNSQVSDNVYATVSIPGSQSSNYLEATNFGFSIPTGATINGILVEVEVFSNISVFLNSRIVKNGTVVTGSFNQFLSTTTEAYGSLGGSSNLWTQTWTPADINNSGFGVVLFGFNGNPNSMSVDHIRITVYYTAAPTVTTEAVSAITSITATGNGTVSSDGGATITERGVCIGASANPTTSDTKFTASGTTGAYTVSMTGLTRNTTYHARAYAINSVGTSYGADVTFTTIQFTNPGNIYASDNTYTTLAATSGVLTVEVSKDAGVNWQTPKTVTFTGSDSLQVVGNGDTELFGSSFTRADLVDANFRIRLSQGNISQVYKNFGFATGTDILTGIEIAIEGKYASSTISLDLLEAKIRYGTSVLPVSVGSQAMSSNGRKPGEGAGVGSGMMVFYDGNNWCSMADGTTIAA